MLSIHAVADRPQWLSTDRHIMQGYTDLVRRPTWNAATRTLSAVSHLVAGEPYRVVLALNGYQATAADTAAGTAKLQPVAGDANLVTLELLAKDSANVAWTVRFTKD